MQKSKRALLKSALAAAFLSAGLAATDARAQATLRWQYRPGETFHYQVDQKANSKASVGGQSFESAMSQTIETSWTVKSVQDGTADLSVKIDRLRLTMDTPVEKVAYDSRDGKQPAGQIGQMLGPIFEVMVGSEFTFKMNELGEVTDVKVPEKLVSVIKSMPQLASMGGQFSEEGLKQQFTQATIVLPKEAISRGKSWTKRVSLPSPVGAMVLDNDYTYEGQNNQGIEKIDVKITLEVKPAEGGQLQLNVKSQDAKGTFLFDNSKGRLSESSITRKMEMSVTAMGVEQVQTVDSTESMKLVKGDGG